MFFFVFSFIKSLLSLPVISHLCPHLLASVVLPVLAVSLQLMNRCVQPLPLSFLYLVIVWLTAPSFFPSSPSLSSLSLPSLFLLFLPHPQSLAVTKSSCSKVMDYLTLTSHIHQSIDLWRQSDSMSSQHRGMYSPHACHMTVTWRSHGDHMT